VPDQTVQHYVAHAMNAACQVPLFVALFRNGPGQAT
jgi:hypothetical protein